ncbi:MAG: dockerin type I repeat-containing protein [Nitrosomonas sp.]|nr:MAG: dockerin type I repeat-containing protein [Nitrosomonas sp.]
MTITQPNDAQPQRSLRSIALPLCLLLIMLSTPPRLADAQHLDIEIWGQGNALFVGYCRISGVVGCDLSGLADALHLPATTLPIEATTGKLIFPADLQDLPGGPFKTKNPGFQSVQNALLPNELISYRALGKMKYWDPALSAWYDAPPDVQIRLFGGLEASADVRNDLSECAGQLICFSDSSFGIDGSTVFSGDGIHGGVELVADITGANGILHTHLSFFLEDRQGRIGGPSGAYLIEMQLLSNARFFPSDSFLIVLNAGLDAHQFAAALIALTGESPDMEPPPQPVIPVSIPGDADLDGDIDRIDVALILLAVQNNETPNATNAAFDVDKDGAITRADAALAKTLCTLRLCNIPVEAPATALNVAAIYDHHTGVLNLNDIQADSQHYRAQLQTQADGALALVAWQSDKPRYATPAQYDAATGILQIPSVFVNGKYYRATLQETGNLNFQVKLLEEINSILD